MLDFLQHLVDAPLGNLLIIAGLFFLGIAAVGKVVGRIEPDKAGRVMAGFLGVVLLAAGVVVHVETDSGRLSGSLQSTQGTNKPAGFPDTGKWYYITSFISGLNLDVQDANRTIGGPICQAVENPDQVSRLTPSPNHPGYFFITSRVSGLNLDVYARNHDVGGRICQAAEDPEQVWQLTPSPNYPEYFFVTSNISGLNLDVYAANHDVGGRICQAAENPKQVWRFRLAQ